MCSKVQSDNEIVTNFEIMLQMSTQLCNTTDFLPFDSTQEPIFPSELQVFQDTIDIIIWNYLNDCHHEMFVLMNDSKLLTHYLFNSPSLKKLFI